MVAQVPDELLLFPSPGLDWNLEEELDALPPTVTVRILKQQPAVITNMERARTYYPRISNALLPKKWMHTYDLVVRGILEASNEWVRMCDDDDEMFADVRPYLDVVDDNVGIINGDFYFCDFIRDRWVRKSGRGQIGMQKGAQGSTNCFRKQAVQEASVHWEPGPWPDWQLAYHMHKLGWTNFYANEIFSIQHWHGNNSSKSRSGYISWAQLATHLEVWWSRNKKKQLESKLAQQALPDYIGDIRK